LEGFTLQIDDIREIVQQSYNLDLYDIEKVKNVYKINTAEKQLCLKVIKYELPHFLFILGAIKHLQNNVFEKIPGIIKTVDFQDYIKLDSCNAYLTPWIEARESNYDNPLDITNAALKLAQLHIKSRGFEVSDYMRPRVGWFKWIETYKTRKEEILDFKRRIDCKEEHTEFDSMYLNNMEEELERCDKAIENLIESQYYMKMKDEIDLKGFCHHDYAHHNVLVEKDGSINIIDFDYTILDSHLHDLSSFLIRRMKNGKWDLENALQLLDAYNSVFKVEKSDIPIISAFMEFPQDYWQVGIQYYWEKQPWGEDFFLKKLSKILEDKEDKQDFIDEFRGYRYKG
jgi:CotS family spore coat protein